MIGFAGPRVIEQTIRQKLPAGFQRAEFQVEHGFVDAIVKREEMKDSTSAQILMLHQIRMHTLEDTETQSFSETYAGKTEGLAKKELSAWDRVLVSRMAGRPTGTDYVHELFSGFYGTARGPLL